MAQIGGESRQRAVSVEAERECPTWAETEHGDGRAQAWRASTAASGGRRAFGARGGCSATGAERCSTHCQAAPVALALTTPVAVSLACSPPERALPPRSCCARHKYPLFILGPPPSLLSAPIMAFAPKPGCPMCGIVASAAAPTASPSSPSNPSGPHEILWRDDNFTVYRESANPVSSKGHIVVVFKYVSRPASHLSVAHTLSQSARPFTLYPCEPLRSRSARSRSPAIRSHPVISLSSLLFATSPTAPSRPS